MDANIIKKFKTGSILKIIMICAISFTLIFFVLGVVTEITPLLAAGVIGFIVAAPVTILYVERFMTLNKSIKYLNKYGYQNLASDVTSSEFNLPISKICLGNQVFYAKNPPSMIPYSMVVWVYIHQTRYMGLIPTDETIDMFCRDGQRFEIRANRNELNILLQRIQMYSPDLILGYGNEQMKLYEVVKKNFKNR